MPIRECKTANHPHFVWDFSYLSSFSTLRIKRIGIDLFGDPIVRDPENGRFGLGSSTLARPIVNLPASGHNLAPEVGNRPQTGHRLQPPKKTTRSQPRRLFFQRMRRGQQAHLYLWGSALSFEVFHQLFEPLNEISNILRLFRQHLVSVHAVVSNSVGIIQQLEHFLICVKNEFQ